MTPCKDRADLDLGMPVACYGHAIANLQVKNVPPEIYDELRRRASAEHVTIRDYVLALLRRDQQLPLMGEWLAELDARAPFATEPDQVDVRGLIEAERDGRDDEIGSGFADG